MPLTHLDPDFMRHRCCGGPGPTGGLRRHRPVVGTRADLGQSLLGGPWPVAVDDGSASGEVAAGHGSEATLPEAPATAHLHGQSLADVSPRRGNVFPREPPPAVPTAAAGGPSSRPVSGRSLTHLAPPSSPRAHRPLSCLQRPPGPPSERSRVDAMAEAGGGCQTGLCLTAPCTIWGEGLPTSRPGARPQGHVLTGCYS